MKDVQSREDTRGVKIQQVGVAGVVIPIEVKDKNKGYQSTVGTFDISVELPADRKGTHMSRFIEYIQTLDEPLSIQMLTMTILPEIKNKLEAEKGMISVGFPYFVDVEAPVSKKTSKLQVYVTFSVYDEDAFLTVDVPVTTLCPCSKEISEYGAHNQRGHVSICIKADGWVWIEELIEIANKSASCAIYPLLKRSDEKSVTETAYNNPRFVEDVAREAALLLDRHPQISKYNVVSVNHESIHNHNAFACVEGGDEDEQV